MQIKELARHELLDLIHSYDCHVQESNEEGNQPVCIDEFLNNDWLECGEDVATCDRCDDDCVGVRNVTPENHCDPDGTTGVYVQLCQECCWLSRTNKSIKNL